jgi:regulator of Ty1 transposition protein 103
MAGEGEDALLAAAAGPEESFTQMFVTKLEALNETHQSINTTTLWIRYHHKRSRQAAEVWAAQTLASPPSRHLLFVYLLNDVLQTCRRGYPDLCDDFSSQMQLVLPKVAASASPQVKEKIARVINVWEERGVLTKADIGHLRNILTPDARGSAARVPAAAAAGAAKAPVNVHASLSQCLEALQTSEVLDRITLSTQADPNLAQVLKDEPIDDPSQLAVALGRADAAVALVQQNNAALLSELEDRKRLILLLCTAVERQDSLCAQITAATRDGDATLARVVQSMSRLDQACASALRCRAEARGVPAPIGPSERIANQPSTPVLPPRFRTSLAQMQREADAIAASME